MIMQPQVQSDASESSLQSVNDKNLESLPVEIFQDIASHLLLSTDLTNLSLTNHRLFDSLSSPQIYKRHVARVWDIELWDEELDAHFTSAEYHDSGEGRMQHLKYWKRICDLHSKVECFLLEAKLPSFQRDWETLRMKSLSVREPESLQSGFGDLDAFTENWILPHDPELGSSHQKWIKQAGGLLPYILLHHKCKNISNLLSFPYVPGYLVDAVKMVQNCDKDEQSDVLFRRGTRDSNRRSLYSGISYSATVLIVHSFYYPAIKLDAYYSSNSSINFGEYLHQILDHELDIPFLTTLQLSSGLARTMCVPAQSLMAWNIYKFIQTSQANSRSNLPSDSNLVFPPVQPFTRRINTLPLGRPEDFTSQPSLAIYPWTDHCLRSIMIALESETRFVGYYSYGSRSQVSQGPMRITLNCARVRIADQTTSHWILEGKGLDSCGQFSLRLRISPSGSIEAVKNYGHWEWEWAGVVTSLGLSGVWGRLGVQNGGMRVMHPGGLWWIWPETWSVDRISSSSSYV